MERILILDLYDTVLKDIYFDFNKGTKYLHKKYFSDKCTFEEIKTFEEKFFDIAISEILNDNPTVNRKDIFYVGNDYKTDVMGATEAGLKTIWYNVKHCPNVDNVAVWDIDDFREISKILELETQKFL